MWGAGPSDSQTAGADAWVRTPSPLAALLPWDDTASHFLTPLVFARASQVNGPYVSDTHTLWTEIEAMVPPPRPRKRPEFGSARGPLRHALTDRGRAALAATQSKEASSEASSSNSKLPTGSPAPAKKGKQATETGEGAAPPSERKMAKSAAKKAATETQSPSPAAKKAERKAKTHRPRSASPAKRPAPTDAAGQMVQPKWNATGPPRRAPGEVINRWNHQGLMNEAPEAAAGWKMEASEALSQSARSTARSAASAVSTATSVPQSRVTGSPSTRGHPNPERRSELRGADMLSNINYYATTRLGNARPGGSTLRASTGDPVFVAPDNDRKMKEASWVSSQAWFESLRYYPKGEEALENDDCEATYSGNTHGSNVPAEHLENDVRNRCGLAAADPGWMPSQLPEPWAPALANRLERLRVNRALLSRSPSPERLT